MRLLYRVLLGAALACGLLFWECSLGVSSAPQNAGGGSEVVGVAGTVADSAGNAVANAVVKLRRADYVATAALAKRSSGDRGSVYSADTRTDDTGAYLVANVDTGIYLIEIIDSTRKIGAALRCTVETVGALLSAPRATMRPTASVRGRIPRHFQMDSTRVTVSVYGLDRVAFTDTNGNFVLPGIAEGTYSLRFVSTSPDYLPFDTAGVTVGHGDSLDIGQIRMPMGNPGILSQDSLAIRAILDSNGLWYVPVQQVMEFSPASHRVTGLHLQYLYLRTLTGHVGALDQLRTLDAEHDSLTSLPREIGQLKVLKVLNLRGNGLTSLPAEIGGLDSLSDLVVSENHLSSLPAEIGSLGALEMLDASGNELTSLPTEVTNCRSLTALVLSGNRLRSLPDSIGNLASLEFVALQFNQLSSLPASLTSLTSVRLSVSVDYNALCSSVTTEVEMWLNAHSVDAMWGANQDCH
jgi:hypothetical protein